MKIKCPACQAVLSIPPAAAGKVVKCPCGKQLRAPGAPGTDASSGREAGAATPQGATPQGATPQGAAPQRAAPQRAAAADARLFDELTEGDLQPVAQAGMPTTPVASGNAGQLLREHAATAGGGSGSSFRVGPLASPWVRLGAAFIDGFVINLIMLPTFAVLLFFGGDVSLNLDAAMSAAETDADKAYVLGTVVGEISLAAMLASIPAAILFALMITKSGQTPGKKLCKIRIVRADNKQLPGFVKGVVVRSWLGKLVYSTFVGLVGVLLIFGVKRQTFSDMMAGTIVVES
ncbi:RDD family protein [bacterium]|nr:RDD family protein [bacterium]